MAQIKAKILERDILNDVCEYLRENDHLFWRSNNIPVFGKNNAGKMTFRSMPKYSMKGVPDIIVVLAGEFIGIEVKRPGLPLRPEQEEFRKKCISKGGHYHVVTSVEDIRLLL